jgi:hypothetical protein
LNLSTLSCDLLSILLIKHVGKAKSRGVETARPRRNSYKFGYRSNVQARNSSTGLRLSSLHCRQRFGCHNKPKIGNDVIFIFSCMPHLASKIASALKRLVSSDLILRKHLTSETSHMKCINQKEFNQREPVSGAGRFAGTGCWPCRS